MRRLGWALLLVLSATAAAAQTAPLLFVHEEIAKPSRIADYEKTTKELVAMLRGADIPFYFNVSSSNDFHYYYYLPMNSFGDVDKIMQTFMTDLPKKAGADKVQSLMRRGGETMEYTRDWILVRREDLSYNPATPRVPADRAAYAQYDFYFLEPGTEDMVDGIANAWKAASKEANVPDGFTVYQAAVGGDLPMVVVVLNRAMTATDVVAAGAKNMELLGDKGRTLVGKTMANVRRIETKYVRYRPDLSNPAPPATK